MITLSPIATSEIKPSHRVERGKYGDNQSQYRQIDQQLPADTVQLSKKNVHFAGSDANQKELFKAAKEDSLIVFNKLFGFFKVNEPDIDKADGDGRTPLHHTILSKSEAVFNALLQKKAMVNTRDSFGITPLNDAIRLNQKKMMTALLGAGADPNVSNLTGDIPLHTAYSSKVPWKSAMIFALLDANANPDAKDAKYGTLLHRIVTDKNIEKQAAIVIVRELLKKGANPIKPDSQGKTPLNEAILDDPFSDISKLLIAASKNRHLEFTSGDLIKKVNKKNTEALRRAASVKAADAVRVLVNLDANPDIKDGNEQTSIMTSAAHGDTDSLSEMLKKTKNIDKANAQGQSAIFYAVLHGQDAAVRMLCEQGANLLLPDYKDKLPIDYCANDKLSDYLKGETKKALESKNKAFIQNLRDSKIKSASSLSSSSSNETGSNPIPGEWPDENQLQKEVALLSDVLIESRLTELLGQDTLSSNETNTNAQENVSSPINDHSINSQSFDEISTSQPSQSKTQTKIKRKKSTSPHNDPDINTSLQSGFTSLTQMCIAGNLTEVKRLLRKGSTANQVDAFDNSPLLLALKTDKLDIAQYLLQNGADPNKNNHAGDTPLMQAVLGNHRSFAKQLLKRGADPDQADLAGQTPLMKATLCGNLELVKLLLRYGANPRLRNHQNKTAYLQAQNSQMKAELLAAIRGKYTLATAIQTGDVEMVQSLLQRPVELNQQDRDGHTYLSLAARAPKTEANREIIQILLEQGASRDFKDKVGHTPLHWAVDKNRADLISQLACDGNIDMPTATGLTPLMLAARKGYVSVVKQLLDANANSHKLNVHGETAKDLAEAYGHSEVSQILE